MHASIRQGRMIALQKARGGVKGIVVGDVVRRLVARTMAQQLSKALEAATAPHQYAMSTRAGTECVVHVLQVLTEIDLQAKIVYRRSGGKRLQFEKGHVGSWVKDGLGGREGGQEKMSR